MRHLTSLGETRRGGNAGAGAAVGIASTPPNPNDRGCSMNPKIVIGVWCIAASPFIVLGKIDQLPVVRKRLRPGFPSVTHVLSTYFASPVEEWF